MSAPAKKILIVLSDAHSFPVQKTSSDGTSTTQQQPTSYFLMELSKPLEKLLNSGYEVTFTSPKGLQPQPDPNSEALLAFAGNIYERKHENELIERMKRENGFSSPRPLSSISDEELETFAGVLIPGGHAPLVDLGDNPGLGRILHYFHSKKKPTAAIFYGPYALLSTKYGPTHEFEYKGYKITSWSDVEERMIETLLWGEIEKVESQLRENGAELVSGVPEKVAGRVTVDREVVSGANPQRRRWGRFLELLAAH